MAATSAGLLMYHLDQELYVLLVHPGGPYFKNKDNGWWTIPKGLVQSGEDLLTSAIREFHEETGIQPAPPYISLGQIKQKGGKVVHAWAFEGRSSQSLEFQSNLFELEWPPRSGNLQQFPEVDKAEWYSIPHAREKMMAAQIPFLDTLHTHLSS